MSLLFAANGNLVDHAAGPYNIFDGTHSAGTLFVLFRTNEDTQRQSICTHVGGAASVGEYAAAFRGDLAGDPFNCFRQRGTTYLDASANAANFAAYALNTWLYLAFTWNTNGANSDQKIYLGSRTLPLAEPSAYATQTVGSGTIGSGSGAFRAGNSLTTTREFRGDIAYITIIPAVLTLEQLIALQFRIRPVSGALLTCHYGFPGTSCIDLSGNANHGAVTGATATAHAPIQMPWGNASGWRGNVAGAAPAFVLPRPSQIQPILAQ